MGSTTFVDFFNDLKIPVTFALRGQLLEVNTSIVDLLLESPIQHEIGSHGYYHRDFTKLSHSEAEYELRIFNLMCANMPLADRVCA